MAEGNDAVMDEVMYLLEAEPSRAPASLITTVMPGPDIPPLRGQLSILVFTGDAKEATGTQLTQEQVKSLSDKDIEKYTKSYETYVGAKTTKTLLECFLALTTKALGSFVWLEDADTLLNDLRNDYLAGGLALRCRRMFAVANSMLITTKHIDFSGAEQSEAEQSSATAE